MSTKKPTKTTTPTPTLKTPEREFENYIGLTPDERKEIINALFRAIDSASVNWVQTRNLLRDLQNALLEYKSKHDAVSLGLALATLLSDRPTQIISKGEIAIGLLTSLQRKLNEKFNSHNSPTPEKDSDK